MSLEKIQVRTNGYSMICLKIIDCVFKRKKCLEQRRVVEIFNDWRFTATCTLIFGHAHFSTDRTTSTYAGNECDRHDKVTDASQEKQCIDFTGYAVNQAGSTIAEGTKELSGDWRETKRWRNFPNRFEREQRAQNLTTYLLSHSIHFVQFITNLVEATSFQLFLVHKQFTIARITNS